MVTETTLLQSKDAEVLRRKYGDCSQLLYHPKLMASSSTHFVQLCQGTTVIDGGSGSGSHGRGGSGSSTALDGGGYIDNRGGAHSSYDDHRHRLTVTTLVTTARARAAAVSCAALLLGGGRRCLAHGD